MIYFLFMEKDLQERNNIVNEYYKDLTEKCRKITRLDSWCQNNLGNIGILDFKDVVTADFETLKQIKGYMDQNNISVPNDLKKYLIKTLYEKVLDRAKLVEKIDVTVCPYCNRNFINSAKAAKKRRISTYQIDHFFNKSQYPIMAVSFYNLIPVCPSCNRIKSTGQFSFSPYEKIGTDRLLRFSFEITGVDFLNHLKVVIAYQNEKIKDNIKILGLEELYKIHDDVVKELIEKKMLYTDVYIHQMNRLLGMDDSLDEINRHIIFG